MKTIILTTLLTFLFVNIVDAQSTNYRAQGNYYSAKENYQKENYKTALEYVYKSKEFLGGTNRELQYLHIMTAYKLKKYEEALQELEVFFKIRDNIIEPVYFTNSVEDLTKNEVTDLTKLIDPIYEAVEKRKANPCGKCSGTGLALGKCKFCNGRGTIAETCMKCKGEPLTKCTADDLCWGPTSDLTYRTKCRDGFIRCGIIGKTQQSTTKCAYCNGSSTYNKRAGYSFACSRCEETGYERISCPICKGKGEDSITNEKVSCTKCNGHGF